MFKKLPSGARAGRLIDEANNKGSDDETREPRACVASDCYVYFLGWNWGMGAWWASCSCFCDPLCMGCSGEPTSGGLQWGGCYGGCDVEGTCDYNAMPWDQQRYLI